MNKAKPRTKSRLDKGKNRKSNPEQTWVGTRRREGRWLSIPSRSRTRRREESREEKNQEQNNISLPNIRATECNNPINLKKNKQLFSTFNDGVKDEILNKFLILIYDYQYKIEINKLNVHCQGLTAQGKFGFCLVKFCS